MASMYDSSTEMIQRGFGGLGGIAEAYQDKQEAEAPLSPFEQMLADVIAGRKTPEQAAAEHKAGGQAGANIAGARNGPQQPQAVQNLGNPGGPAPQLPGVDLMLAAQEMGPRTVQVTGAPQAPQAGLSRLGGPVASAAPGPSAGGGLSGQPRPQNRRDMNTLLQVAPHLLASRRNDAGNEVKREGFGLKRELAGQAEEGKNQRAGQRNETSKYGVDVRAGTADKDRATRMDIAQLHHEDALARINAAKQRSDLTGRGSKNPRVKQLQDQQRHFASEAERALNHAYNLEKNLGASDAERKAARTRAEQLLKRSEDLNDDIEAEMGKQVVEVPAQAPQQTQGPVAPKSSLPPGFSLK